MGKVLLRKISLQKKTWQGDALPEMSQAMQATISNPTRREFLQTLATASAGLAAGASALAQGATSVPSRKVKLGLDNFSVRALKWKAPQLIDYAASLKTDSLFISDLDAFESLEDKYLKEIRAKAEDKGLQIHVGTWSICPTSKRFNAKWGKAEEHLATGIRVAKALGSPVIRVVLGSAEDRQTEGGIYARSRDTVQVCLANRSRALDAEVKIAVENHAGDLHSLELAALIEEAGKDYVGANMDSGNALWTLEDPLESLENLGPYAITTSLRDGAVWEYEDGAKVQWTAMGEGHIDWKAYFKRFAELCPSVPVHIETISGFARPFPYLKKEYWEVWPEMPAKDFARFAAMARRGKPFETVKNPEGKDRAETEQLGQKAEIERSIKYCKEVLGLGLKA